MHRIPDTLPPPPGASPKVVAFPTPLMSPSSDGTIQWGRVCYGAGMAGIGIQHYINGKFVAVILSPSPGSQALALFGGIALVALGAAVALGLAARASALVLGTALLAALVLHNIPAQAKAVTWPIYVWNNEFKLMTLSSGAFAVAASLGSGGPEDRLFTNFACYGIALTCATFGSEHYMATQFCADLVPAWIPAHMFWAYFGGTALIAAGVGMMLNILARPAAWLLGLMIFIWFLILHIPRAVADLHGNDGNELTSVFEALSFSGIAFILSKTLPKKKSRLGISPLPINL